MSTTAAEARAVTGPEPSARGAYRWLWAAVVFSLLAFGVGAAWDRGWHASHPFEDFWSPPHLQRVLGFVIVIGFAPPVLTGLVDLSLRARTP